MKIIITNQRGRPSLGHHSICAKGGGHIFKNILCGRDSGGGGGMSPGYAVGG